MIDPNGNLILAGLSPRDLAFLLDGSARVHLASGVVLYEAGSVIKYAFFPLSGLISLLMMSDSGSMIETGFIGREGVAGLSFDFVRRSHFVTAKVTVATTAFRVSADRFERLLAESDTFRSHVARNANRILERGQLLAACNLMHRLELRLSRWLLQAVHSGATSTIEMTQDSLSQILGVTRARLNEALKSMEINGVLARSSRGFITIIDVQQLERMSCACIANLRFVPQL